jgi:hypothetical protein
MIRLTKRDHAPAAQGRLAYKEAYLPIPSATGRDDLRLARGEFQAAAKRHFLSCGNAATDPKSGPAQEPARIPQEQ